MNEEHLNYGFTTFDDLIKAILSIFQILTGEGWSKLIYLLNEAVNPIIVYTYFLLFVFLGGFFLVNLIVAVINESFLKAN